MNSGRNDTTWPLPGLDDDRRDGAVEMGCLALGVPDTGTIWTVNVLGLGGKIPRGIQGNEAGAVHRAHSMEQPGLIEALAQIVKEAEEVAGFHRVERLTDVVI